MNNGITVEERRRRAAAIQQLLNSLPLARHSPLSYIKMMEELSHKESVITKLKAFVRFLSKLNPMEYFHWMKNAFSLYKPIFTSETPATQELFDGEHSLTTASLTASPKKGLRGIKVGKKKNLRR